MKTTKIFYDLLSNNAYDENQNLIANSNLPIFTYSINTKLQLQLLNSTRVDSDTGLFDDFYTDLPSGVGSCASIDNNFIKFNSLKLRNGASGTVDYIDVDTDQDPRKIGEITLIDDNNNSEIVYYNGYKLINDEFMRLYTADSNYNPTPITLSGTYIAGDACLVTDYPLVKDSNGDCSNSGSGEITYTLDLDNAVLFDVIINRKGLSDTYFEFQITDGTDKIIIQRFPVRVNGILDCFNNSTTIPLPAGDYYTKSEVDALIAQFNEFIELTDTPNDYSGFSGYMLVVNSSGDGIEFVPSTGTDELVKVESSSPAGKYLSAAVDDTIFEYDSVDDVMTIADNAITADKVQEDFPFDQLDTTIDNDTIVNDSGVLRVDKVSDDYIDNVLRDQILGGGEIGDIGNVTTNNAIGDDILVYDGDLQQWINENKHSVITDTLEKADVENVLTGDITTHTHNFQLENGISDNIQNFDCSDVCKTVGVKFTFDESKLPNSCLALYHFNTCHDNTELIPAGELEHIYTTSDAWKATLDNSGSEAYYIADGEYNTGLYVNYGFITIADMSELINENWSIDGWLRQSGDNRIIKMDFFGGNFVVDTYLYDFGGGTDGIHLLVNVTFDDDSDIELDYFLYATPDDEWKHFGFQYSDDYLYICYDGVVLDKYPLMGRKQKYGTMTNGWLCKDGCRMDEVMVCKTGRLTIMEETGEYSYAPTTDWFKTYYGVLEDCGGTGGTIMPKTPGWDRLNPSSLGDITISGRQITLSPISGSSCYYYDKEHRIHYIDNAITSPVLPDTSKLYLIYINDDGELAYMDYALVNKNTMASYPFVCIVAYFKDSGFINFTPDQHSWDENYSHHAQVHFTVGTRYGYGMELLFDTAISLTNFDSFSAGSLWDEDIRHTIDEYSELPFLYRLGTSGDYYVSQPDNKFAYFESGNTYASWNKYDGGEWVLEEGTGSSDFWWNYIIAIPFATGDKVFQLIGQKTYPNLNQAKAKLMEDLREMQVDNFPNVEFILCQAYLVKRDGQIQPDSDGKYINNIYSHYFNGSCACGGGSDSDTGYYKMVVDMAHESDTHNFTLPTGWNDGDKILIKSKCSPLTVRPDASEQFWGGMSDAYLAPGFGVTLVQQNCLGDIEIEKFSSYWKIRRWSGKWVVEGARLWLPMDRAEQYMEAQNVWKTIVIDKLFNQNLSGDTATYVEFDSPYNSAMNISAGISYGMFENHSFFLDQYGYLKLDSTRNLNAMVSDEWFMDLWVKRKANSDGYDRTILEQGDAHNSNSWRWYFNGTNKLSLAAFDTSQTVALIEGTTDITSDGNWHRVSLLKKGNRIALYVDGVRDAIGDVVSNTITDNNGKIRIFHDLNGEYPYVGNAKDLFMIGKIPIDIDIEDSGDTLNAWYRSPYWLLLETV